MFRRVILVCFGLAAGLALAPTANAQVRPYIGYAYPAGGQQGTTTQVKLGGQGLENLSSAIVSGTGVEATVVAYRRNMSPQDTQLLREQLRELRDILAGKAPAPEGGAAISREEMQATVERIEKRMAEYVNTPANRSISNIAVIEVKMAPDAPPGARELRLVTPAGVSNPLVFHVGQLAEVSRKPMISATLAILGKEELALRKRPPEEVEQALSLPCTVNGQIASGEVNRYRFQATKGQKLVFSSLARQLIPYIADAVPGWFQPVLTVHNARGKEVAYNDDYRFKPDPVLFLDVPEDGEYTLTINDALYRGREDFVYRISIGELPFVTSIYPLGAQEGAPVKIEAKGWNLDSTELFPPPKEAGLGIHTLRAQAKGLLSNPLPFAVGSLPEAQDNEPNDDPQAAQKVTLPIIVNGRIDRGDDWDIYQFEGKAGDSVVAEVFARRLDSPVDSVLRVSDSSGKLLAVSDDVEDQGSGLNTHHADSYLIGKLPTDGTYFIHLGDSGRNGGDAYGYRLRISPPQPDFELRVVSSSLTIRNKSTGSVEVFVLRKDGFAEPIKLSLKNPPEGFQSAPVTLAPDKNSVRLGVRASLTRTEKPVELVIEGVAKVGDREIVRQAVPAEDRMQAFLWRHLVPAQSLQAVVYDPSYTPPPKRTSRLVKNQTPPTR